MKKEYTLEHFVNVFHNRQLFDNDDSATRLAKLILYLSGHYSLAHEHVALIAEEKYEVMGKTKPLAKKLDVLLKIFNQCCALWCGRGDRLALYDTIHAVGDVPKNIDIFVEKQLEKFEKEDWKVLQNSQDQVDLIEKGVKPLTKKQADEFLNELVK